MIDSVIILVILSIVPVETITEDQCDLIEINHFYDERGRLSFSQTIFYVWQNEKYEVRDWRLLKNQAQYPLKTINGDYQSIWHDGDTLRRVIAKSRKESWTQYDVELIERRKLPKEKRIGLGGLPPRIVHQE